MADDQHMDLAEFRRAAHDNATKRREARADFEKYAIEEAQREAEVLRIRARVYAEKRGEGEAANGAEIIARGESADALEKWRMASALKQAVNLRLAELERDAASLNKIGEWSLRLESLG